MNVRGTLTTILCAGAPPRRAAIPANRRHVQRMTLEEAGLDGVIRRAAGGRAARPPSGPHGMLQLLPGR